MDFELTIEQLMLREASRTMLADRPTIVRDRVDHGADPYDARLWQLGCELGWTGLAVPERFGGTEQGLVELVLVAEELGRAAAAGPFVPTALVARAVSRAGSAAVQSAVLPELVDGGAAGALALAGPGGSGRPTTTARATADGYVVSGTTTAVQDAERVRWLLVAALVADEPALLLVDATAPGVSIRRQETMDLTRAFCEVRFADVAVDADRLLGGGPAEVALLLDAAAVLTAADALGAMERLLAMTVDHVTTRRQFDRPLGSFQAVKQTAATMAIDVHSTRAAVHYAAMAMEAAAPDAARAASAAAAFAGPAARRTAGSALQLLGGIGFTWEHDLHLYLRRATVDAVLHGDPAAHGDRLVGLLQHPQERNVSINPRLARA